MELWKRLRRVENTNLFPPPSPELNDIPSRTFPLRVMFLRLHDFITKSKTFGGKATGIGGFNPSLVSGTTAILMMILQELKMLSSAGTK